MLEIACDCIAKFDAKLLKDNTRVDVITVKMDGVPVERTYIGSSQIEKGRGKKKAATLIPNFCPFCGEPYEPIPAQEAWTPIADAPRDARSMVVADEAGNRAVAYWTGDMWAHEVPDRAQMLQLEFEPTRFHGPFGEAPANKEAQP